MIGNISYDEMIKCAANLSNSSDIILNMINQYNDSSFDEVKEFCNQVESYSRFLVSSVELYKDSDEALKMMVEKNK